MSRVVDHGLELLRVLGEAERAINDGRSDAAAEYLEVAVSKSKTLIGIAHRGERRRERVVELEAALRESTAGETA